MAPDNYSSLLHGYLDGELDLVRSLDFEEHLKACPDCAQELWTQRNLRESFRAAHLYERAPEGLEARIRAALPRESKVVVMPRRHLWNWAAVAAAIVLVVFFSWRMLPGLMGRSQADLLAQEVVASHIRSLQPGHLMDVESTDQHTVKPWFNGKIDFSPPVKDFAADGFPLIGGRLDYVDQRPAAALVYQRQKHLINVYVWPGAEKEETAARVESKQGYNIVFWQRGGMYFCAVSDLNSAELQQFAQLLQGQQSGKGQSLLLLGMPFGGSASGYQRCNLLIQSRSCLSTCKVCRSLIINGLSYGITLAALIQE